MMAAEDEQDLTRKQRREQARAHRRQMEEAAAAQTVRRTRLIQLASVIAVVVAAVVVIAIATGSGSKGGIPKSKHVLTATVQEVSSLLGGIPQEGATLGAASAPVTLRYFGDLECPVCKEFTLGALSPLIQKDVRTGKLRIEYRSLETATREPEVFKTQQAAALAAGKQNKAWYFIELFYHEQGEEGSGYVTESYIQNLAQQVPGLNLAAWTAARSDPELSNSITSDSQAANAAGFTGTPSFLIGKTGGAFKKLEYASLTNASGFESAVEQLIKS